MTDTTTHTDNDIRDARALADIEALDPDDPGLVFEDMRDLREVAVAADAVAAAEARLTEAVAVARAHGRSWNRIAVGLNVSRQAARQKYAHLVEVDSSG